VKATFFGVNYETKKDCLPRNFLEVKTTPFCGFKTKDALARLFQKYSTPFSNKFLAKTFQLIWLITGLSSEINKKKVRYCDPLSFKTLLQTYFNGLNHVQPRLESSPRYFH